MSSQSSVQEAKQMNPTS